MRFSSFCPNCVRRSLVCQCIYWGKSSHRSWAWVKKNWKLAPGRLFCTSTFSLVHWEETVLERELYQVQGYNSQSLDSKIRKLHRKLVFAELKKLVYSTALFNLTGKTWLKREKEYKNTKLWCLSFDLECKGPLWSMCTVWNGKNTVSFYSSRGAS